MHRICSLCVEKNAKIAERSEYSDIGSSTKCIVLWLEEIVVSVIADICYNLVGNQLFPYFMMHFLEKHVVCHLIGGEWYRKTRAYINNGTSNYTLLRFFVRSSDPMHRSNTYLAMLKDDVDQIVVDMGLKVPTCHLVYKLDGRRDVFDFEMLKLRLEVGQTHELAASHRKLIPIADILNQSAPADSEKRAKTENGSAITNNYVIKKATIVQGDLVEGDKVEGDKNVQAIPEELTAIPDKLITENIQSQKEFAERLLSQLETGKDEAAQARFKEDLLTQLEASEDKTTREIAAKAKTYSQKKRNPLTFLREIVCGVGSATSFLADAPNAVATLTAITTAVTTVVTQYGPEIAKILPQIPILSI